MKLNTVDGKAYLTPNSVTKFVGENLRNTVVFIRAFWFCPQIKLTYG